MAPAKSEKRQTTAAIPVLTRPEIKAFLKAAAEEAEARVRKDSPSVNLGLGPYLLGLGLQDATRILGMTLAEFTAKEKKGKGR